MISVVSSISPEEVRRISAGHADSMIGQLDARVCDLRTGSCVRRRLTFGVLLGSFDVFLELLFLRVIRVLLQQLFPGFDRAFRIALALPANDAQVEQRSRMIGLILQRLLKLGDGSVGVSRVPERRSQIG